MNPAGINDPIRTSSERTAYLLVAYDNHRVQRGWCAWNFETGMWQMVPSPYAASVFTETDACVLRDTFNGWLNDTLFDSYTWSVEYWGDEDEL
jgi:hypothetical protein